MKKLLVLFLILGMASLANAGLALTHTDPTLMAGTIDIVLDNLDSGGNPVTDVLRGCDLKVSITSGTGALISSTTFSQFTIEGTQPGTPYELPAMSEVATNRYSGAGNAFPAMGMYGHMLGVSDVISDIGWTRSGPIVVKLETFAGSTLYGTNPADLTDVAFLPEGEIMSITIPEPMTMTLLGLGGLALLRRRR